METLDSNFVAFGDSIINHHTFLFHDIYNTFGIQSSTKYFGYSAYFKRRDFKLLEYNYQSSETDTLGSATQFNNHFIGGTVFLRLNDNIRLKSVGEMSLFGGTKGDFASSYTSATTFTLFNELKIKGLKAGYNLSRYTPDLQMQHYNSKLVQWDNAFSPVLTNQLYGEINLKKNKNFIGLRGDIHNLTNYVYYGENAAPVQANGNTQIYLVRLKAGAQLMKANIKAVKVLSSGREANQLNSEGLFVDGLFYTSAVSGTAANAINTSPFLIKGRIYKGFHFRNGLTHNVPLRAKVGLEAWYAKGYYADSYSPLTQQFHLQNQFYSQDKVVVNFFLSMRIQKVNLYLRFNQLQQLIGGASRSYYATAFYPASRASLAFGVRWRFFD